MPIEYRGGADTPHAHASFQLWWDAAHGSTRHHVRPDAPATTTMAAAAPAKTPVASVGRGDTPRLYDLTPVIELPTILLLVSALLVLLADRLEPAWAAMAPLCGRVLPPETPPPRILSASA
jgi:hypothetical protein